MTDLSCGLSEGWFVARPMPGFRPGGRLTFLCAQESKQRKRPCKTAPAGFPAMLEAQGPRKTPFATLRSDSCAESEVEACCARALGFCASRRFRRGDPEQPNSQQPNPKAGWRWLFLHPPSEPAEERKALRPRAQRASSADFAQLSERSVAKRVLREASRLEYRRAARCEAKGRAVRGRLFAFLLVAQKEGRPPGRTPGMGLAINQFPE
jgi:hypothetical protein